MLFPLLFLSMELLIVTSVYNRVADQAFASRRGRHWGWLGVFGWFAGETVGVGLDGVFDLGGFAYPVALFCGAIGAFVSWLIVRVVSGPLPPDVLARPAGSLDTHNPFCAPSDP